MLDISKRNLDVIYEGKGNGDDSSKLKFISETSFKFVFYGHVY